MAIADTLLTVPEVARYLACSEETVKRLARRGLLAAARVGGRLRFAPADVEAYRINAGMAGGGPGGASYLTRLHLISGVFGHLQTLEEAAALAVGQCLRALNAQSGVLSLIEGDETLVLIHAEGYSEEGMRPWQRIPLGADLPMPEVVRRGEPCFYESPQALLARYPHLAGASIESGAWALMPLPIDRRVIGGITVGFAAPRRFSPDDQTFLFTLAQQCAQAIERARLHALGREQAAHVQALAEASHVFAAARLDDVGAVLQKVAEQIATVLGDNCTIRLISDDGTQLVPAAIFHPDPAKRALLQQLAASANHHPDEGLTGQVFQSGRPLRIPVVDPEELRSLLKPAYHPYLDEVGLASIMAAPLRRDGAILGTLFISRARPGRPYTLSDQVLLEELADRAAVALDNARLYAAERRARAAAERAAERTAALQRVTALLSNPHTPAQVAELVMAEGMRALGASAGALALRNQDGSFALVRMLGYPEQVVTRWEGRPYPASVGAPIPDAVTSGEPIWLESREDLRERYPHLAGQLDEPQLGAWASLPLLAEGQAFGGITFLFAEPRRFGDDDRGFALALAHQCAQAIVRARLHEAGRRAEAEAEAARRRLSVLAEAGARLAGSLDIDATIDAVADLVVPELADWCVIDLVGEDGAITTAAVAHRDPALRELAAAITRRYPIDPDSPGGTAAVLRTLQTELMPEISDEMLAAVARSPAHLDELRRAGLRSSICAPLVARGRALGALALVSTQPGRYGPADLPLVEELAGRAALALDNARLYAAEREAVRLRDTFFSVAAHELKTPLTSLLGQAQLLQRRAEREGVLNERDQRATRVIANQAARLNRMILTMLDSTRLEHGRLSIERRPIDLAALAEQVADELRPTLSHHSLTLTRDDGPHEVQGDALRLEQVIQNLIGNAVKYSPAGGPVRVCVERAPGAVTLAVEDEGIGIPAAAIPQLFQRFFRATNEENSHISGMGIGLYVVKEIVALHGGEVAVESQEGVGSRFSVRLPVGGGP